MKRWQFLAPLALFAVLLGFLAVGLNLNPREVPSPLIGKPAPAFALARLDDPAQTHHPRRPAGPGLDAQRLGLVVRGLPPGAPAAGGLRQAQHGAAVRPELQGQARRRPGLAGALRQSRTTASLFDIDGRVGIDFGVYGVPETFVIDKQGVIRFKQIGPVTPEVLRDQIEPLLKQLNA